MWKSQEQWDIFWDWRFTIKHFLSFPKNSREYRGKSWNIPSAFWKKKNDVPSELATSMVNGHGGDFPAMDMMTPAGSELRFQTIKFGGRRFSEKKNGVSFWGVLFVCFQSRATSKIQIGWKTAHSWDELGLHWWVKTLVAYVFLHQNSLYNCIDGCSSPYSNGPMVLTHPKISIECEIPE